jgi:hypothetical protein
MAELSDDELLDFDRSRLADWDEDRARRLLVEQPELYRNHLAIARGLQGWADRLETPGAEPDRNFTQAIQDIAAHLRQGDFLPGAAMFEEWTKP